MGSCAKPPFTLIAVVVDERAHSLEDNPYNVLAGKLWEAPALQGRGLQILAAPTGK